MGSRTRPFPIHPSRKHSAFKLAFCWVSGFAYGIASYSSGNDILDSLMYHSVSGQTSIAALLSVNLLPALLSAFAVFLSAPAALLIVCFGRAVLIGFVSTGILCSFGYGSWLVYIISCFSDLLITPCLYFYWLRHLCGSETYLSKSASTASLIAANLVLLFAERSVFFSL